MTTFENHQIKGITIKNAILTIISTASIVASVTTTYYGLKSEIQSVNADRITESRVTNLRLSVLENEIALLQKEVNALKYPENKRPLATSTSPENQHLLTATK